MFTALYHHLVRLLSNIDLEKVNLTELNSAFANIKNMCAAEAAQIMGVSGKSETDKFWNGFVRYEEASLKALLQTENTDPTEIYYFLKEQTLLAFFQSLSLSIKQNTITLDEFKHHAFPNLSQQMAFIEACFFIQRKEADCVILSIGSAGEKKEHHAQQVPPFSISNAQKAKTLVVNLDPNSLIWRTSREHLPENLQIEDYAAQCPFDPESPSALYLKHIVSDLLKQGKKVVVVDHRHRELPALIVDVAKKNVEAVDQNLFIIDSYTSDSPVIQYSQAFFRQEEGKIKTQMKQVWDRWYREGKFTPTTAIDDETFESWKKALEAEGVGLLYRSFSQIHTLSSNRPLHKIKP